MWHTPTKLCGRRGAWVGALPSSAGRRPRDAWQRPFPPGAGAGSHDARTLGVCKRSRSWRERSSVRSSASVRVSRGLARPVRLAPGFSVTSSSALSIGKSVIAGEEALHAGIWAAAIHLQGQSKYEQINLARSISAAASIHSAPSHRRQRPRFMRFCFDEPCRRRWQRDWRPAAPRGRRHAAGPPPQSRGHAMDRDRIEESNEASVH